MADVPRALTFLRRDATEIRCKEPPEVRCRSHSATFRRFPAKVPKHNRSQKGTFVQSGARYLRDQFHIPKADLHNQSPDARSSDELPLLPPAAQRGRER